MPLGLRVEIQSPDYRAHRYSKILWNVRGYKIPQHTQDSQCFWGSRIPPYARVWQWHAAAPGGADFLWWQIRLWEEYGSFEMKNQVLWCFWKEIEDICVGGRMHFTRGDPKPKSASSILQALSCRLCLLQLSNPSKLVISKKPKSRIALIVHNAWGLFPGGSYRQKCARLALPE